MAEELIFRTNNFNQEITYFIVKMRFVEDTGIKVL